MRKKRQSREDDLDINITPMLDIVFIMLIFFIVTTSFVKEPGIDPQRPVAETSEPKPRGNILIGVDTEGQIWMNNRRVELTDIRPLVRGGCQRDPGEFGRRRLGPGIANRYRHRYHGPGAGRWRNQHIHRGRTGVDMRVESQP